MYKGAIQYRGAWLAPGSRALELHQANKLKELDAHLKAIEAKELQLRGSK